MAHQVLIIDDEPAILEVTAAHLKRRGFKPVTASNAQEGLTKLLDGKFSCVIIDFQMPGMTGFEFMEEAAKHGMDVPIIMITAYGSIEMAVDAMKRGAFGYLAKPINFDEMAINVQNAVKMHSLKAEVEELRQEITEKYSLENVVGNSRPMLDIFETVKTVAQTNATVLIRGETGTGKELIARALHHYSMRSAKPFIRFNCAAIPDTLLEDELFGHERGAYTGAIRQRIGKFEQAHAGSILLDEIGDVSMPIQAKLLRVLQEGEFDRVGGNKTIKVDVRVIATTNRNLERDIASGRFREDLFYRLNVVPLYIPPLRDRVEDISMLATHFVEKYARRLKKRLKGVSPEALTRLEKYDWPGNVRELENIIERASVMCRNALITEVDVPSDGNGLRRAVYPSIEPGAHGNFRELKKTVVENFEKNYIETILRANRGNISVSARIAGIDYKNFYEKVRKYGFVMDEFR